MKILALSPHTDDVELGCGGSIARWMREGNSVTVIAFSAGNPETGSNWREFFASMDALGALNNGYTEYEARRFGEHRQEILDNMIYRRDRDLPPFDLVLLPSAGDVHQDHVVVREEGIRAFRNSCILAYDGPSVMQFAPTYYVTLTDYEVMTKQAALYCYKSQSGKRYMDEKAIKGNLRYRGAQIGVEYAEAFEVVRYIV